MRKRTVVVRLLTLLAITVAGSRANAAKLVVMAVNSGSDITAPYANLPPLLTPGAKGFLLGVDTEDGDTVLPLGVQDIYISGSGLVNRLVQSPDEGLLSHYPQILLRTEASLTGNDDQIDYRRDDTYLMNQTQATPQGGRTWTPIATGASEGSGFFDITASFGLPSTSVGGVRPLVYVVTTSDLSISGFIVRGQSGFGPAGGPTTETAILGFNTESLVGLPPATWTNPSGGQYADGSNWLLGHVPTARASATFDLTAQYTVEFTANTANDRATITRGDVTFDLGGTTYSIDGALTVGDDPLHSAALTVSHGTVLVHDLKVGAQPGATGQVTVDNGGRLGVGAAFVGYGGIGGLNVAGEMTAHSLDVSALGTVNLQGGTLIVGDVNDIALPDTLLLTSGGSLSCYGQIQGAVVNRGGGVYGFNDTGAPSIMGDYVQEQGGQFSFEATGSDIDHSLRVSGNAHLDGTLVFTLPDHVSYQDKFVVLRADGVIEGGFANVFFFGPPTDFQYSLGIENGAYVFTALEDWSGPNVPEPPTFGLAAVALSVCAVYLRSRVDRPSRPPRTRWP